MARVEIRSRGTGNTISERDAPTVPPYDAAMEFQLFVDSRPVESSLQYRGPGKWGATFSDLAWETACSMKLSDLAEALVEIHFNGPLPTAGLEKPFESTGAMLLLEKDPSRPDFDPARPTHWTTILWFNTDFLQWNEAWSLAEFSSAVESANTDGLRPEMRVAAPEDPEQSLAFYFVVTDFSRSLGETVESCRQRVLRVFERALQELGSAQRPTSLSHVFNFPPEIRTACEQYLIYFGQFLRDLGIEASTEMVERAGNVLFSVTPTEGPEALFRIRSALDVYLSLPENPKSDEAFRGSKDIAVQQLQAVVTFTRAQLELAHAIVQAKDATIGMLEARNLIFQRALASGEPAARAPDSPTAAKSEDREPLLGEYVAVTQFNKGGLSVDLAKIARTLKRSFFK